LLSIIQGSCSGAGFSFVNVEAGALVPRMLVEPDDVRKAAIYALIGALKSAGIWQRTFGLWALAAATPPPIELSLTLGLRNGLGVHVAQEYAAAIFAQSLDATQQAVLNTALSAYLQL